MAEMRRSWLVQRLNPPRSFDNPFSFGGGMLNGGLSENAMAALRSVWSFDYMGAAEFEFGEVPKALSRMAEASDVLTTRSFVLDVIADVAAPWSGEVTPPEAGERTVYVIARSEQQDEVERRIRGWASAARDDDFRTKESVGIDTAIRPGRYRPDYQGWLELNNGYLFFIDHEMFTRACGLFGLDAANGDPR